MALVMSDWQTRNKSFSEKCSFMFEKKILTDCEFHIENEKFQCHKLILAMASPVFQAMFYSGGYNEDTDPILITDIKPDIFLQMIRSIYGINTDIQSFENACELYYAAKKYLLAFLQKECIDYLLSSLNHSNVLFLYEFSKFNDENNLRKQCLLEIQLHTSEVMKSKYAKNMSEDTISSILDFNTLNIPSEMILFKAVEDWTLYSTEMKEINATRLRGKPHGPLKKIRFLTLTTKEFTESILITNLLTDKEKLDILLRLINAIDTPMDNGLCESKQKRRPLNIKSTSVLDIQDMSEARCDGSEWLTSLFKVNSSINLLGIEMRLQINPDGGEYIENVMVKLAEAQSKFHFAEGNIYGHVQYNSKVEILFNSVAKLKPGYEYALHVFLCRPGMYPIGRHNKLSCENNDQHVIDFISHSSWQGAHPFNTTILASVIYTEPTEEDNEQIPFLIHNKKG